MSTANPNIQIAVVAVGLVGTDFISQLLSFPTPTPFRLISLSSSKKTPFSPSGVSFSSTGWKADLAQSNETRPFTSLPQALAALVAPGQKVMLVDNTSSEDVATSYPTFLSHGINIITPNKKVYSGDLSLYEDILTASAQSGDVARFLNEATVGAGLPIISTLKDLVATGDKVCSHIPFQGGTILNRYMSFLTR
jgi:homoserine dehydrogenase